MSGRKPLPEPLIRHAGSRLTQHPPHIGRIIRTIQRQIKDGSMRPWQSLLPVPAAVTSGLPCTAAAMASIWKMWTYRTGAAVYADADIGCGTGSVVSAQLYCPDLGVAGTAVLTAAGGEQTVRLELGYPDAWAPGDTHYVYVQACRVSGTDATTIQVARAWQR